MANATHKRYRVLVLNHDAPQGVCCNGFPECNALLVPGSYFIVLVLEDGQNPAGAIGNLHPWVCTACRTTQMIPVVFHDLSAAERLARIMNGIGHHGHAPIIKFRPSVAALLGVALTTHSA